MKNSTLHRSNLSKERMALLEELKNESLNNNEAPGVYVRPSQEKELDTLWDTFKVNTKHDNSPGAYLVIGFVIGAVCMAIMGLIITFTSNNSSSQVTDKPKLVKKIKTQKSDIKNITIVPADVPVSVSAQKTTEVYTVQSGDTLEAIIIRFYGKYDPSKVEAIANENSMINPNSLSIGQKIIIPLTK